MVHSTEAQEGPVRARGSPRPPARSGTDGGTGPSVTGLNETENWDGGAPPASRPELVLLRVEADQPHGVRKGRRIGGGLVGPAPLHRKVDERAAGLFDQWPRRPRRGLVQVLGQVTPPLQEFDRCSALPGDRLATPFMLHHLGVLASGAVDVSRRCQNGATAPRPLARWLRG